MAGPLSKYSFINAKLRARISKILPEESFQQLAKAPFLDEALALAKRCANDLGRIVTDRESLENAVEAYRRFDARDGGCVKILLLPKASR